MRKAAIAILLLCVLAIVLEFFPSARGETPARHELVITFPDGPLADVAYRIGLEGKTSFASLEECTRAAIEIGPLVFKALVDAKIITRFRLSCVELAPEIKT